MDERKQHWESVYATKAPTEVSWYVAHLDLSLELIDRVSPDRAGAILDVGGGASTLVDDLILRHYTDISVLDISQTAIDAARLRIGTDAGRVEWLVGDICERELEASKYNVWHDRAVFHFLTLPESRACYLTKAAKSVKSGGHLIVGTFGQEGPTRCSGLDVVRYDAPALACEFGSTFRLVQSQTERHTTPSGGTQQFLYCVLKRS